MYIILVGGLFYRDYLRCKGLPIGDPLNQIHFGSCAFAELFDHPEFLLKPDFA